MSKNYYEILGVSKDATDQDIKKAYRKLAHQHHPDRGGDEGKFKEANEAYQVLSNKQKRQQYDQFGSNLGGGSAGFDPGNFGFDGGAQGFNVNFEDVFEQFFGGARTKTRSRRNTRGRDVEVSVDITLEDAFKGLKRDISLQTYIICEVCDGKQIEPGSKMKKCEKCKGLGQIKHTQNTVFGTFDNVVICSQCDGVKEVPEKKCTKCLGEGRERGNRDVAINVPAGVQAGDIIKLAGMGEASNAGSNHSGDLYVHVNVVPHKKFIRRGNDLYNESVISYSAAALGDSVKTDTIDGEVILKIPSSTQNGEVLRIRGRGMPNMRGHGRGDQYVTIKIETPKKVSKKVEEILKQLRDEGF